MMSKPAKRLLELLDNHGIQEHCCPICPNQHGLWVNPMCGPSHYSNLYNSENPDRLRWQSWDLPGKSGSIVGRWGLDGAIDGIISPIFFFSPLSLSESKW